MKFSSVSWHRYPRSSFHAFLLCFFTCIAILTFFAPEAYSAQATLSWNANTESGVTGYKIYYGQASRGYTSTVNAGAATSYTVPGLQDGRAYYFAVTAYNSSGAESEFSQEVTCTTPGTACTYSISPVSQSFPAAGGGGSITVTAAGGCSWSAASNASWLAVDSGSSGSGTGTVRYLVSANTGSTSRTGSLTVAGKTFSVIQQGQSIATQYTISASASGGGRISPSGSVSIASGASQTFSMKPNWRRRIINVTVDGVSVGPVSSYTFTNVTGNHTIRAIFSRW